MAMAPSNCMRGGDGGALLIVSVSCQLIFAGSANGIGRNALNIFNRYSRQGGLNKPRPKIGGRNKP